jgi:hypothetical protein
MRSPAPTPTLPRKRERGRGIVFAIGLAAALVLTACEQASSPQPVAVQTTRTPAIATPRSTPTPTPTPKPPPALAVEKVGASASAGGFMAFAVIANPSDQTAMDVRVDITSVSSTGQQLARRTGSISRIGPGHRKAVAIAFPVGRTLPAQFSGSIASVRWSDGEAADVAQVTGATFIQDARTPGVRVHLVNHGQGADRVLVTAVCWDTAGNIRGGGTRTVTVGPEAQGHDVTIQVSLSTVPASCDAFGVSG